MALWCGKRVLRFRHCISTHCSMPGMHDVCGSKSSMSILHACEVLLVCRWHLFPRANIEERLQHAYESFHNWCVAEKKGSSLQRFELKTFKMTSHLDLCTHVFFRAQVLGYVLCFLCAQRMLKETIFDTCVHTKVAELAWRLWQSS